MSDVEVWHNDLQGGNDVYTHVANVEFQIDDVEERLEWAFTYTQNMEGSWSKGPVFKGLHGEPIRNPDWRGVVKVIAPLPVHGGYEYGLRSSMVGDIFVVDGEFYRCASFGFEKVSDWVRPE